MDLYFKRHDGQAVTCDDFRAAMADANGRDLSAFTAWCARWAYLRIFSSSLQVLYTSQHPSWQDEQGS